MRTVSAFAFLALPCSDASPTPSHVTFTHPVLDALPRAFVHGTELPHLVLHFTTLRGQFRYQSVVILLRLTRTGTRARVMPLDAGRSSFLLPRRVAHEPANLIFCFPLFSTLCLSCALRPGERRSSLGVRCRPLRM